MVWEASLQYVLQTNKLSDSIDCSSGWMETRWLAATADGDHGLRVGASLGHTWKPRVCDILRSILEFLRADTIIGRLCQDRCPMAIHKLVLGFKRYCHVGTCVFLSTFREHLWRTDEGLWTQTSRYFSSNNRGKIGPVGYTRLTSLDVYRWAILGNMGGHMNCYKWHVEEVQEIDFFSQWINASTPTSSRHCRTSAVRSCVDIAKSHTRMSCK
jgi:hypothetical protein